MLRHAVASSIEAEMDVILHNVQVAIPLRYINTQMGHPQPTTPLKTVNVTSNSFVHENITQKKSKSWNIRLYWLRNRQQIQYFEIYWDIGNNNLADY